MYKMRLSVALATLNEENNLYDCLNSVKNIADEIVVVDESSSDKTEEIARDFGAKVIRTEHKPIFHLSKQMALEECHGEWVLQLDADERVSSALAEEILTIISLAPHELEEYQKNLPSLRLFLRHQGLVEKRDNQVRVLEGEYKGFYIPRLNYFLGKYLKHGGVYPDGVIRLLKNGFAYFPAKDVHEQIVISGKIGWLQNNLIHMADPTFKRYLERNSRYIDLLVDELKQNNVKKNLIQFFNYFFYKSVYWFILTLFRHKGILDGFQGIVFSFFSSLRFPRAYFRYLTLKK